MNKINYQKQLDKVIENLGETKPTLLLHSCCAPCSSYVMEYLSQYFDITIDYYNPNIDSKEEYEKRVHEQQRLVSEMNLPIKVIDAGYAPQTFFDMAKGFVPVYAYVHMTQMNLAESNGLALVLAAPVAGHIFPVWHHFKGGKGIAVSFGSLLGLIPMWYPVLSLAVCFLFFSLVIQISPNFYRTVAVYIVNWIIIVFSETNLPKAVHIGVGLISLLILLKMHMSQEEREKMTFQLLWIKR